jgi:AbrB family looped-hinge helix DNA binding protein
MLKKVILVSKGKVTEMIGRRMTSKGQTTIPKEIRDYLHLEAGDRVVFLQKGDEIVIQSLKETLLDLQGRVKPRQRPEDFRKIRGQIKRRIAQRVAHE